MILVSSVILSCCQTWGFLKELFFQKKLFMVLLSSMGLSESLIASYQHLSLFYLTGSDGICGVSMDVVECHLLTRILVCFAMNAPDPPIGHKLKHSMKNTSFVMQPNGPKCTQMVRNAPKHEFRFEWAGSGVIVAKNSNATSWHELLH